MIKKCVKNYIICTPFGGPESSDSPDILEDVDVLESLEVVEAVDCVDSTETLREKYPSSSSWNPK